MVLATSELLSGLEAIVGPGGILTGEDVLTRRSGWISRGVLQACAVIRPRTTEEVSAVLRLCYEAGQPVVPHGGLTGLVEGAHAHSHEIVLSLELMNRIEEVDDSAPAMTVQAGVVLQAIQQRADAAGLMFPLDLGARGSAMIGGLISTNAGGNRVIRYGMTRNLVLGLEAVPGRWHCHLVDVPHHQEQFGLRPEAVVRWLRRAPWAVVTRAILKLQPQPRSQCTALIAGP